MRVDVAIVGGGVGGGALATVLARDGLAVLLLERSALFEDRVRGEWIAPWGVVEAIELGLYDELIAAGGHHLKRHVSYDETREPEAAEAQAIPLGLFRPGVPGPLCIGHPHLCQTLYDLAGASGADTRRGVEQVEVRAGAEPRAEFTQGGERTTVECSLLVGADGRASSVRRQLGVELREDPPHHLFTGLLVEGAHGWPEDLQMLGTERDFAFLAFPQGEGRVRLYGGFPLEQRGRFAGTDGPRRFLEAFRLKCCPGARHLAGARPAGPCRTYPNQDTWTDRPDVHGAVLVGDAAGYNDPIIGQGLSITLRDVRLVRDALRAARSSSSGEGPDFSAYAEERRERMRRLRFAASIVSALDCEFDAEAPARRGRYFERMQSDPSLGVGLAAALAGPEMLPAEAFSEQTRARVLES